MPRRLLSGYRAVALLALNSGLLFVLANVAAAGWLALRGERTQPAGPDLELLAETWNRPYQYEPFTQFRESPFSGRFVNVDARGFRRSQPQPPWPPLASNSNIFVFGGSTTFGYGLADGDTIPSQLGTLLADVRCEQPVAVYNLGRSNYYSTQERVLFNQLLGADTVPSVALFIDGLNEFQHTDDQPKLTVRLERLMAETAGQLTRRALKELPLVRLARRLRPPAPDPIGGDADDATARAVAEGAVARWLANRRLISAAAEEYGVTALFVWQPTPAYDYDLAQHPSAGALAGEPPPFAERTRAGYEHLRRKLGDGAPDVVWLATMQHGRAEQLYVDRVHYNAGFSREIATVLATQLSALPRLGCPPEAS